MEPKRLALRVLIVAVCGAISVVSVALAFANAWWLVVTALGLAGVFVAGAPLRRMRSR